MRLCRGGRLRPPRDAERSEGERATHATLEEAREYFGRRMS
jgi:hypothetical protein